MCIKYTECTGDWLRIIFQKYDQSTLIFLEYHFYLFYLALFSNIDHNDIGFENWLFFADEIPVSNLL